MQRVTTPDSGPEAPVPGRAVPACLLPGELSGRIEALLDRVAPGIDRQTDFRRSPQGAADGSVIFRGRLDKATGKAVLAEAGADPLVESARLSGNRLTLRFAAPVFDALHAGLRADPADPLRLSATATGKRIAVDFLDPNANKALHVGHLRNAALGHALASLWQARGASVVRQSVVCDIGRNIAEAMAGLIAAGAEEVLARPARLDRDLGGLYGAYVAAQTGQNDTGTGRNEGEVALADQPIARELTVSGDAADDVLALWRAEDPGTLALWRRVIDRVLGDQAETLSRLGIRFDRTLLESAAVPGCERLGAEILTAGLGTLDEAGIVLETGREDYPRCPLTRSDGFATEHLRALVLWRDEALAADADADAMPDRFIHVMGEEWLVSSEIRIDTLRRLGAGALFDRYTMVAHQLVRVAGSDMKSSAGNAILIDDLVDALERTMPDDLAAATPAARRMALVAAALLPFLLAETGTTLDIDLATLADGAANPGWAVARLACGESADAAGGNTETPEARHALLQGERLRRVVLQACERTDPVAVARFLQRLAEPREETGAETGAEAGPATGEETGDRDQAVTDVTRAVLARLAAAGLAALGIGGDMAKAGRAG
jgi:arginyl-tRNA synthetase